MSKALTTLKRFAIVSGALLFVAIGSIQAQQKDVSITHRSLFWMDQTSGVEVYFIEVGNEIIPFNLVVASDKEVKVIYRTEMNSMLPVVKELVPVKSVSGRKYYNVQYHFSKTTIWMSLDFEIGGKTIESLGRYFYGRMIPEEKCSNDPIK